MTSIKRLKRSTASPFQRTTSTQSNQWNRRFKTSKAVTHDDDVKIVFQHADTDTPNEDPLYKSAKDCKQVNARYRKLMDEENLLLQDLRKLQIKKQLLIKRSRQLKDEEIIKLNSDLQKEKEIRVDLGKKFSALEKKLNQLEKEIEDRNRNKDNGKSIKLKNSWLDKSKDDSSLMNDFKGSKSLTIFNNTTNQSKLANSNLRNVRGTNKRNTNLINLTDGGQSNDQSNDETSSEQLGNRKTTTNLAVKTNFKIKTESIKIEAKLNKKIADNLPKNFVGPLLLSKSNVETKTQQDGVETKMSTLQSFIFANSSSSKESAQQNLNSVIRDVLDRRLPADNQQQNSVPIRTDSITINPEMNTTNVQRKDQQQQNNFSNNNQSLHDIFDDFAIASNTTTTSNVSTASNVSTNQENESDESRDSNMSTSAQIQSPSTINLNNSSSSSW